jgi:hypothetical protein
MVGLSLGTAASAASFSDAMVQGTIQLAERLVVVVAAGVP